jgi:hypothetical protein
MSSKEIIKNLIERLYNESLRSGINLHISQYDTSGNNYLEAEDGTYLGNFSNRYDQKSIFNKYGNYGSRYSQTSIFNPYSQYGSKYSPLSPVNPYTTTPPKIFINGNYYGKLTINKYIPDAKPTDVFLFYVLNKMNLLDEKLDDLIDLISRM